MVSTIENPRVFLWFFSYSNFSLEFYNLFITFFLFLDSAPGGISRMVSLRRRRLLGLCSGKRNSFQYLEISFQDLKIAQRIYAKKTQMSFFLHLTLHIISVIYTYQSDYGLLFEIETLYTLLFSHIFIYEINKSCCMHSDL
jgi:hypothetical protein